MEITDQTVLLGGGVALGVVGLIVIILTLVKK